MEISNPHQQAEIQGIQANSFGFEMNAKMYDILISKMYTNKPGAVIRELSANAWDSHRDAGNEDVPFEIQLPTWIDKSFYIRDFGTGIPHDKFESIYTNVGSSTKEGSNDFIGGFGLGSKTPFTMTDTFMVENWNAGIKTTWLCFKDKGEPKVSKVATEASDEPSGVKASFSFDSNEVPEFTRQVVKQLRYFPVKPVILGGEGDIKFPPLPDDWDTKEYFFINTQGTVLDRSALVMGNVSYDLNLNEVDYSLHSMLAYHTILVIKAPIGAVDVPPSREQLEMTPKTKAYIKEVIERLRKNYVKETQDSIDKCRTHWELRLLLSDVNLRLVSRKELTWKGVSLQDEPVLFESHLGYVAGYSVYTIQSRYRNVYRKGSIILRKEKENLYTYYVNDLGTGYKAHINNVGPSKTPDNIIIFDVNETPKDKPAAVKVAIAALEAEMGVKVSLLSDLLGQPPVKPKTKAGTGTKSKPNQVFLLTPPESTEGSLSKFIVVQSDMPKDAYYLEYKGSTIHNEPSLFTRGCRRGLIPLLDKPVYLVRSASIKDLDKSMVLLTDDHIKGRKEHIKKTAETIGLIKSLRGLAVYPSPDLLKFSKIVKSKKLNLLLRYSEYIRRQKVPSGVMPEGLMFSLFRETLVDLQPSDKFMNLKKDVEEILDLFSCLNSSYSSDTNKKRLDTLATLINNP